MKIHQMAPVALMAAVLCIIGPLTIPVGPVPVSVLPVALYFIVYVLGMWRAVASCMIYIFIGLVGLPIFAGYTGGPAVLLGPTGGYVIGYLLLTMCSGFFVEKFMKKIWHFLGMVTGLILCYMLGTVWLMFSAQMTVRQAMITGVAPFVLFDILKIFAALLIGPIFRRHLRKANVI